MGANHTGTRKRGSFFRTSAAPEPVGVLRLVPIYVGMRTSLLTPLADRLAHVFGLPVEQAPPNFDPELAFDPARGQYNSRILLAQLDHTTSDDIVKVLGVAGVDLFIPVLTYVFGEAQLDSRAAVVSTYRLDNELYGLPPDPNVLFERLCKEAIHELGHTVNLVHCHHNRCVMRSSTYVEDIDLKSDRFCPNCQRVVTQSRLRATPLPTPFNQRSPTSPPSPRGARGG